MNILTVINIEHMFNECPWFVGGNFLVWELSLILKPQLYIF